MRPKYTSRTTLPSSPATCRPCRLAAVCQVVSAAPVPFRIAVPSARRPLCYAAGRLRSAAPVDVAHRRCSFRAVSASCLTWALSRPSGCPASRGLPSARRPLVLICRASPRPHQCISRVSRSPSACRPDQVVSARAGSATPVDVAHRRCSLRCRLLFLPDLGFQPPQWMSRICAAPFFLSSALLICRADPGQPPQWMSRIPVLLPAPAACSWRSRHVNPAISAAPGACLASRHSLLFAVDLCFFCTGRLSRPTARHAMPGSSLVTCCPGGGLACLTASVTPVDAAHNRPPVRVFDTCDQAGRTLGQRGAALIPV